jgi:hypothetical protein
VLGRRRGRGDGVRAARARRAGHHQRRAEDGGPGEGELGESEKNVAFPLRRRGGAWSRRRSEPSSRGLETRGDLLCVERVIGDVSKRARGEYYASAR